MKNFSFGKVSIYCLIMAAFSTVFGLGPLPVLFFIGFAVSLSLWILNSFDMSLGLLVVVLFVAAFLLWIPIGMISFVPAIITFSIWLFKKFFL